jgi:hypothetical protein
MQEICQSGSEGGAKLTFVPTPILNVQGSPEACRERGVGRLSRRRHSCAGGRPWVLKRGSRLSGRSGVIPLEIRFIESDRREGVPEAQLREWAFDKLVGGAGI